MLDKTIFQKVTKDVNGKNIGLKHREFPEYIDIMKALIKEFNRFVDNVIRSFNESSEIYKLKTKGVNNNWQNSGYYNPYFWNKILLHDNDYDGIILWLLFNSEGLSITIGTTKTLESKNNVLADKINENMKNVFSSNIDNFDTRMDNKYISYLYKKDQVDVNNFVKALTVIVPLYNNIFQKYLDGIFDIDVLPNNTMNLYTGELMNIKNIILYGSPGVGKTHNINKLISLIEDGKSDREIFEAIKANEKSYSVDILDIKDRVKFITFHQSFGYEDFIEGFRPNEEGNIELEKGVFLEISKQAEENILKSGENKEVPFSDAFNIVFKEKIENEESIRFDLKREGSFFKANDYNDKTIYFEKQSGTTKHTLSIATLEKMYYAEENTFIHGGLAVYYEPILDKLLEVKRTKDIEKVERKNYYLVIDEINRGNISKIFGELITLIEEDKRDKLEVTLPYSKQSFKIPSNLYIIGTMNSTDKSIALIDIALRRRFTFLKMKPKAELIEYQPAKTIFENLNRQIEQDLGEDYQLGHSYFMKIENDDDLEFILEYKIIPLLEEYYYGDDRLGKILESCKIDRN